MGLSLHLGAPLFCPLLCQQVCANMAAAGCLTGPGRAAWRSGQAQLQALLHDFVAAPDGEVDAGSGGIDLSLIHLCRCRRIEEVSVTSNVNN